MQSTSLFKSLPVLALAFIGLLPKYGSAGNVISTNGFESCMPNGTIAVKKMNVQFDRSTNKINFDVAGSSQEIQNVSAALEISAYGKQVYQKGFDPCGTEIHVPQLCPVPKGNFAAQGSYQIPQNLASMIPSIAYTIPNLDGDSKMELKSTSGSNNGTDVACIHSQITNNKSFDVPAVSWVAAGIAGAALIATGLSAVAAALGGSQGPGSSTSSPTFTEVMLWFQGVAMNGMVSVQYPSVYASFSSNFAFSAGLIPWAGMERSIDSFRSRTGGNLTESSWQELKNATLINQPQNDTSSMLSKRGLFDSMAEGTYLMIRDGVSTSVNGSQTDVAGGAPNDTDSQNFQNQKFVQGIQYYAEQAAVPKSNVFMTALLVFAIVIASIIAAILLFKVILEAWALFGKFPKKLTSFRKNYWWIIAKTVTNLILLLYGVWVLYCIYQFREGDSWAAKILAAVTLALFTVVLVGFTWKIWSMANKFKKAHGDTGELYENKEVWRKYSIFYDNYRRGYWWLFIPTIIYMFAKGCVLAAADGKSTNHSLAQTAALLIVDSMMLVLLLLLRPYNLKSGNWINIVIQVVRVISVVCILIFVEKLGFSQTTKTVTGVVLIVLQAVMTGLLAILIAINAIINCCRMNPHRKQRKENEKTKDDLTSLDAHNSLLMYPMMKDTKPAIPNVEQVGAHARGRSQQGYDMLPLRDESDRLLSPSPDRQPNLSTVAHDRQRSMSPVGPRQPQLPDLDFKGRPGMAI
ncbi:MAG: hypothetical protein Q9162_004868 [Coniocarpon cinnabarinum]